MLANYNVLLCFIVLSVTVCTVGYACIFCGDQNFVYFVSFLSMIICEVHILDVSGLTFVVSSF